MTMTQRAEIHQVESIEQFAEFVYAQGWTDGLPVFPPTRKAVADILDHIGRDPGEVLGTIFPGDGEATIEKIAANCAMAGCLPEYVPVVLAAVECIVDPEFPINTTQSTGSASIFTLVSGPIVSELKFHTREWIFGPNGGRANATIGRAIRLILWNIGRAHPGKLIKGTMGHPSAWSYCIGEEQRISPWEPVHVDFGIAADRQRRHRDEGGRAFAARGADQYRRPQRMHHAARARHRPRRPVLERRQARLYLRDQSQRSRRRSRRPATRGSSCARHRRTRAQIFVRLAERQETGRPVPFPDPYTQAPSEREVFVAPIPPDEINIVVGGGEAPQMGQCVSISSRSSVGKPLMTKRIRFPAS